MYFFSNGNGRFATLPNEKPEATENLEPQSPNRLHLCLTIIYENIIDQPSKHDSTIS
jgi:hypothetical protein